MLCNFSILDYLLLMRQRQISQRSVWYFSKGLLFLSCTGFFPLETPRIKHRFFLCWVSYHEHFILPPTNGVAKVMFSVVSVHRSFYPQRWVPTIQGPFPPPLYLLYSTLIILCAQGLFRLYLTAQGPPPPKHVHTCSLCSLYCGRLAFNWNVFLFVYNFQDWKRE